MNEEQEKVYLLAKERVRELRVKLSMADSHSVRTSIELQMERLENYINHFESTV